MRPAGVIIAAGLGLLLPASAPAATFEVDSLRDGADVNLGDSTCADGKGRCTLRAAIDTANEEPGSDEIRLPKGRIKLTEPEAAGQDNVEGDLDVTEAVEIDGRSAKKTVIEQTVRDRVLRNDAPFAGFTAPGLQLYDVTLTGGDIGGAGENGGAGLQNNEFALLDGVVIRDNVVRSDPSDNVPGGGIYSSGILGLSATTVKNNVAIGNRETQAVGAGVYVHDGQASIQEGSKVVGNSVELRRSEGTTTAQGGGILIRNPGSEPTDSVSIFDSTIARNTALGSPFADGGGIFAGVGTHLDIARSTISGNRSRRGGGLYTVGVGSATIDNSTISGNVAGAGGGAAIFHQAVAGAIDVTRTTIAENQAPQNHFAVEAGEQAALGSVGLFGSIVFNSGKECGPPAEAGAVESDGGRNVTGDKTCGFSEALFDLKANPELSPLADHDGPTQTHALKRSSPAIDRVPCSPGIDQRGLPRPQRTDCDVGSYERKF